MQRTVPSALRTTRRRAFRGLLGRTHLGPDTTFRVTIDVDHVDVVSHLVPHDADGLSFSHLGNVLLRDVAVKDPAPALVSARSPGADIPVGQAV